MKVSAIRALLCLASAVTLARAAHGQESTPTRHGFWFSGGLGVGSLGCRTCDGRTGGFTGDFVVGGTFGQMFLAGFGISGWTKTENGTTLTVAAFDVRGRLYLSPKGGLYFTLGGGAGTISAVAAGFGSGSEFGAGLLAGMGYDISIGRLVSLTPYVQAFGMKTVNIDANVFQIGIAVTTR